jgi:co-chaperonin GroES (HSP10)
MVGEWIAAVEVGEKFEGDLIMTPDNTKERRLAKVVSVGDTVRTVAEGDVVFAQIPVSMRSMFNNYFELEGTKYMQVKDTEIVATVKNQRLSVENFTPNAEWCLLESWLDRDPNSLIINTDNHADRNALRYRILKLSDSYTGVYKVGEEVVVQRERTTLINFGSTDYWYIHVQFITGRVL